MNKPESEVPAKEQPGEQNAMVKLLRARATVLSEIGHEEAMNDAIIMAQAAAMIEKLGQRWIPVSERLPDEGSRVAVIRADGHETVALRRGWKWVTPLAEFSMNRVS